jgi:hypothetical protein
MNSEAISTVCEKVTVLRVRRKCDRRARDEHIIDQSRRPIQSFADLARTYQQMSLGVNLHTESDLRILRDDYRFIESAVALPNIWIDTESNVPTATRATEKVTGNLFVFLPWHLLAAVGTWVNIPVVARGAHSRQDRTCDSPAILACFALVLFNGRDRYPVIVAIIVNDAFDFAPQLSHELKERIAIRIPMRAVDTIIGIDFDEGMCPQVRANASGVSKIVRWIARIVPYR